MSAISSLTSFVDITKTYLHGFKVSELMVNDETITYLEAGDKLKPTVLFIHCFNGSKNLWRPVMDRLKSDFHLLAPELPAFGLSAKISNNKSYSYQYLTRLINHFANEKELTKFHLVGASAGSTLAASYMFKYPEKVLSMGMFALPTLFGNKGSLESTDPLPPEFYLPTTVAGVDLLINHLIYDPPNISTWAKKSQVLSNKHNYVLKLKLLNDCLNQTIQMTPRLRRISIPTLFMHGDTDKVTPQASVDYFVQKVPNIQHFRIEKCAHMPYVEKPEETAAIYRSFIKHLADNRIEKSDGLASTGT